MKVSIFKVTIVNISRLRVNLTYHNPVKWTYYNEECREPEVVIETN